jgi:hypothetical protein
MSREVEMALGASEWKILKKIFGPVQKLTVKNPL